MGISLTVAIFIAQIVYVAHTGDTRAYSVYSDAIEQLTLDRSYIQRLIASNSSDFLSEYHNANIIQRPTKSSHRSDVDLYIRKREIGNRFIMCTPELWQHVTPDEMRQIALTNAPPLAADKLVNLATERAAVENVSVIIFH